ncbi:MAG: DedA family protein [Planctomycetes bacterium]|nr:DedA family protein [Planctomycetota bacterium]
MRGPKRVIIPEKPATDAAPRRLPSRVKARWRLRMQRLAQSRFALFFMCLLSFADACCSPILPEVLYVPMILLRPQRRWFYAFWCSASSVVGGIVGYGLGFWLWEHGLREFAFEHIPGFTPQWYADISEWYGSNAFLWVWLGGFTPLPYKIFTVAAGVCHDKVDFWVFLIASITSRFPRIYLTVYLLDKLGKPAFDLLTRRFSTFVLLALMLVLGVIVWRNFF